MALDEWLAYLGGLGIEGVAYGGVVLRRRDGGSNWVRGHEIPSSGTRPAGDHIVRLFEAEDFLAGLADEAKILDERYALAEAALVEQHVFLRERTWEIDAIEIKLERGLGFRASVDPLTAHLLAELDGERTLAEITAELADREGKDRRAFGLEAVPVVRGMLELGFLELRRGR